MEEYQSKKLLYHLSMSERTIKLLKRVGFDRNIKRGWLDKTADLLILGADEKSIRNILEDDIIKEIPSKVNRRKSISILIQSWVNVREEHKDIHDKALKLYEKSDNNEKLALHWCMMTLAYELFFDISEIIGKLLSFQNEFSLGMVRRKVFDIWGERSTLYYATERVLRSMRDLAVLEQNENPGQYRRADKIEIKDREIQLLLVEVYLIASKRINIPYTELQMINALFPFKIDATLNDVQSYKNFKINTMGMELVISL